MGLSAFGIIFRVYLKEALPELIRVTTITAISLIGLTAMAGAVGAGGLGDFAITYGQGLNKNDLIFLCVITLLLFVSLIQIIGTFLSRRTTNKKLFNFKRIESRYLIPIISFITFVLLLIVSLVVIFKYHNEEAQSEENIDPIKGKHVNVKIGVCGASNDYFKAVQYVLNERGYHIDIDLQTFAQYNLPNEALNNNEIDLNAFQHKAFLKKEVDEKGYDIVSLGNTLLAPLTIYSKKHDSLIFESSQKLKIGIPSDATNLSRGLRLLESAGYISLSKDSGYSCEIKDIVSYNANIEIIPNQAQTLPTLLPDYDYCIINDTYAVPYGLNSKIEGLFIEDAGDIFNPYINIIAVRKSDLYNPYYKAIMDAYQSDITARYMITKYPGSYIPAFTYNKDYSEEENLKLTKLIDDTITL
jgi:D-methionine transport system substrate-binding protein